MLQTNHIIGHLAAIAAGDSVVVQYHYNTRVIDEEIWLWDEERRCHVRTTPEEIGQVLTGWEEEASQFERILLPVTL